MCIASVNLEAGTACTACEQPTSFPPPNQVANTLTFTWPLEVNALQTQLQMRVKSDQPGAVPDNSTSVMNGSITTKTVIIDSTNCGRIYQARLRHNCGGGMLSPWKFRPNIATTPCNRLGDFSEKMLVYPNPADDELTVQYQSLAQETVVIKMVNIAGEVVHSQAYFVMRGMNVAGIDVSKMAAGIYILSIKSGAGVLVNKVKVKE